MLNALRYQCICVSLSFDVAENWFFMRVVRLLAPAVVVLCLCSYIIWTSQPPPKLLSDYSLFTGITIFVQGRRLSQLSHNNKGSNGLFIVNSGFIYKYIHRIRVSNHYVYKILLNKNELYNVSTEEKSLLTWKQTCVNGTRITNPHK